MKKLLQNKHIRKNKKSYTYGGALVAVLLFMWFAMPFFFATSYSSGEEMKIVSVDNGVVEEVVVVEEETTEPIYIETPEQVKNIYMSACVAGTPSFREDLAEIAETTEVNSIIIDIKDFSGGIAFDTDNPVLAPYVSDTCGAPDMEEFVRSLNERGVYVIGRITVFQDPLYAAQRPDLAVQKASDRSIWSDHKGLHFIDVGAREYWEYIVELSKESHKIGFDELNFDYVRYPSDGPMKDIYFPMSHDRADTQKREVLREFFVYLYEELNQKEGIITSADLFGMTTTNTDDLNIGQYLEYALPYFDYIAPMVYPSHYPKGFNGWDNPNHYVYDVVYFSMKSGFDRAEALRMATSTPDDIAERVGGHQLRTWIQDFDYGGNYDAEEVRAQIQASYDAGVDSWMIWAPSNRYTIGALEAK